MTDLARLREFAQSLIDNSRQVEDECGAAGAHQEITVRGICERVIAEIDAQTPLTSPDRIPPRLLQSLDDYASKGLRPGHFLSAVLCDELFEAMKRGDDESLLALPAIVTWIRDNLAASVWGCEEIVERWIARPIRHRVEVPAPGDREAARRARGKEPDMNGAQQKALAWEAFQAGVRNGGDSSPADHDYAAIQKSIRVAFESWWRAHRAQRLSPRSAS